ncbi:MAG TPA: hypothetical protein VHG91_08470 [Longimicrobium sp.]|nr:hypothetical protein [Longimicrobium sp.]
MRTARIFSTLLLSGTLALAGCEASSRHQDGDPDEQGLQASEEQGKGAGVNDTTPHRPGVPPTSDNTP